MKFTRSDVGVWQVELDAGEEPTPDYLEALPRYLTAFDPAFKGASDRSEFDFILALLRVRGLQDAGWDPYETTLRAIDAMVDLHEHATGEPARHLKLWIYGHIIEASEPYELLANLVDIAEGGVWKIDRFRRQGGNYLRPGRPRSPAEKIAAIEVAAATAGMPQVAIPLREIWDRDLRNAVFHADYSFHQNDVRILHPTRRYTEPQITQLANRALAYHRALAALDRVYRSAYREPVEIPVPPTFSDDPEQRAIVIVREGEGATGLKDAWTAEQIAAGKIPFHVGRFRPGEPELLGADPQRALLPPRAETEEEQR